MKDLKDLKMDETAVPMISLPNTYLPTIFPRNTSIVCCHQCYLTAVAKVFDLTVKLEAW